VINSKLKYYFYYSRTISIYQLKAKYRKKNDSVFHERRGEDGVSINLTLGSLFDGIGGFPLIWERLNGKGACLWASEIEDFPIAVTEYHFEEENKDD